MTIYSQNDTRWRNNALGYSTDITIGEGGCFVTAFANIITWAGHDMTPDDVNNTMRVREWFSGALVTNHQVPNLLFPNDLTWLGEIHWAKATPMDFFSDANDPNITYIVYIWINGDKDKTHFTMVSGTTGNDLVINDSWDGTRKNLSVYGTPGTIIQAAYKWQRNIVSTTPTVNQPLGDEDMAHPTADEVIQAYKDIDGTVPTQTDIDFHTSNSTYKSMIQGFFSDANDDLLAVNKLDALTDLNNELSTKIKNLTVQVATSNATLPAILDKDTAAGRSFRAFYQPAIIAIPVILGAVTLPAVQTFFSNPITTSSVLAVGAALFSYIQNKKTPTSA